MSANRRCCRPGCPNRAVATLTYVYADSTAVVGPLAVVDEPHSWDLCAAHALRITAPRGWNLVRHPDIDVEEDDDLTALLDAVTGVPAGAPRAATVDADRLRRLGVADPAGAALAEAPAVGEPPRRPRLRVVRGTGDDDAADSGGESAGPGDARR